MRNAPIVEEIRRARRAYAEQFDNDLHAICEDLRRRERESNREIWAPVKRPGTRVASCAEGDSVVANEPSTQE
jgi:hypothetical protein